MIPRYFVVAERDHEIQNPTLDDDESAEIRARHVRHKRTYLRHAHDYVGWAIFVGWKPA